MSTKEELLNLISGNHGSSAPIYFASTHGIYDLQPGLLEHTIVPPNTYIFESASVGESTLVTIDEPLWYIMQNRAAFAAYLNSDPSVTSDQMKQIFKNLVYYKPGDKIYKRTLLLEDENEFNPQWSYYKFIEGNPNVPFPEAPPDVEKDKPIIATSEVSDPPYTNVMKSFREEHFPPGKTRLRGFKRILTGSDIRFFTEVRKRDQYHGPAIFIFSSCASFWTSKNKKRDMELILEIGRTHQLANQQFAEMGFTSGHINGENGKPVLLGLDHINVKKRTSKGKTITEQFSSTATLQRNLKMTSVDLEELRYLEMVGDEITRFVRPRFEPIRVPEGAATIFTKVSEVNYIVAISSTGKTWWTYQEMEDAIDAGQEIYVSVGREFTQLKKKAGKYTSALRQGGTRRIVKKSKSKRKFTKTRKFRRN